MTQQAGADVGVIGSATMGHNLALNLAEYDCTVAVFDGAQWHYIR